VALSSYKALDHNNGFSLLEMVVAVAILGLSLGALYQSVAGATRIVRIDEQYAYAVELARSLLADNAVVSLQGMNNTGETSGGFTWSVRAEPMRFPDVSELKEGQLQYIDISVAWGDGDKTRSVDLHSIVAGMEFSP